MIQYAETRDHVRSVLEKVLSHGANYRGTEDWKNLSHVLERSNEVKGIILYADHNDRWHGKTVFIEDDLKKEEEKIRFLNPLDIRHDHFYHRVGFTDDMYKELYSIPKSLEGLNSLAALAKKYADNLSQSSEDRKIIFYCGPVNATGGFMDLELNLEHLFRAIVKGYTKHEPIFDQTVFESHLVEITKEVNRNPKINQSIVLEQFYKPLYHNWLVREMRFLFNWQTSGGAKWEMSVSKERHILHSILPSDYVDLTFTQRTAPQN